MRTTHAAIWSFLCIFRVTVPSGIECEMCSGPQCSPTSHSHLVTCPHSTPYCLNTIHNMVTGEKNIIKRCASPQDCNADWMLQAECLSFDPVIHYTFAFNCTYCCFTTRCNTGVIPNLPTIYRGQCYDDPTVVCNLNTCKITELALKFCSKTCGLCFVSTPIPAAIISTHIVPAEKSTLKAYTTAPVSTTRDVTTVKPTTSQPHTARQCHDDPTVGCNLNTCRITELASKFCPKTCGLCFAATP